MKYIGIIPARYQSSRFPGKPLCIIGGKSMIERVYSQVGKVDKFEELIVATDDERIEDCVHSFGGKVFMTASTHCSGTDRCAEVFSRISKNYLPEDTVVVNIQGDEPFIRAGQVEEIIECMENRKADIATLIQKADNSEILENPNTVKVVRSKSGRALYFSRYNIPFLRKSEDGEHYRHIGMYAYRGDILLKIVKLPVSALEKSESLEQLRWLENDFHIATYVTKYPASISIDTPDDLKKAVAYEQKIHNVL